MASLTSDKVCNINNVSYNSGLRCCALGACIASNGGNIYAKMGRVAMVVAPAAAELSRTWNLKDNAITCANTLFASNWYIPNRSELTVLAECLTYMDAPKQSSYWSSIFSGSPRNPWRVSFETSARGVYICRNVGCNVNHCVRAIRKVYY